MSPNLYMERFKEAMYKYFILVPDFWYLEPATTAGRQELPQEEREVVVAAEVAGEETRRSELRRRIVEKSKDKGAVPKKRL